MANNIKFSYLYRDSSNYKNYSFLVFPNPSNVELSKLSSLIQSKLIDNTWFYVNEWKLPDLRSKVWDNNNDPTWHEFENVEYTEDQQNTPLNLDEIILEIEKTHWYKRSTALLKNAEVADNATDGLRLLIEKTKDLANELTNYNVIEKGLRRNTQIAKERIENYAALRNTLFQRGVNLKK